MSRVENPKVFLLVTGLLIILLAGIINYLVEGVAIPPSVPITRSIRVQTLVETVLYLIFLTLGVIGVYVTHGFFSTKSVSWARLVVGITLYLLAIIAILAISYAKGLLVIP